MNTFPIYNKEGQLHAFEISNYFTSRNKVTIIAGKINGVEIIRKPKRIFSWFREEVFCEFQINGVHFQIDEPFGDNSRYWIGKKEEGGWCTELELVHNSFKIAK